MEYRVVPAPTHITVTGDAGFDKAAAAYQSIINTQAALGWHFITMDSTTVQETSCGCNSGKPTVMKIIVFGRETIVVPTPSS